jgi:HK97 family phage major capsid protein
MEPKELEEKLNLITELRTKFEEYQKGILTKSDFAVIEKKIDDRLDAIELKLNRPPVIEHGDKAPTPAMKAWDGWLRKGHLGPEERKVLVIADDTLGGYLQAPPDYVNEIIKGITEISEIRSISRVRQTSAPSIKVPKRTGQFSAARTAEVSERTERTGLKYGLEEMQLPEAFALVKISKHDLEDSAFNLEGEINGEAIEQFGVLEGKEFTVGTAHGEAEGFLVNAEVIANGVTTTAGSNVIAADDMVSLQYSLKSGYRRNATWVMAGATVKVVRLLKESTTNAFIWQPGLQLGQPSSLLGNPVLECVDMPSGLVDNQYEVAYGDFKRGYLIGDRIAIEVQRLIEKYAEFGEIGFMFRKRFNGQVVLAEAIKLLKIKA